MSLFSKIILPRLEQELVALEPEILDFILKQLKYISAEVFSWVESKLDIKHKDIPQ